MNVCWQINAFIGQYSDHWQTTSFIAKSTSLLLLLLFCRNLAWTKTNMPRILQPCCSLKLIEARSFQNIKNPITTPISSLIIHSIYRVEIGFSSSPLKARQSDVKPLFGHWLHASAVTCGETCVVQLYRHDRGSAARYRRKICAGGGFRCTVSAGGLQGSRPPASTSGYKSSMRWNSNIFVRWAINEVVCQWPEYWPINAFIYQSLFIDQWTRWLTNERTLIGQ